MTYRIDPANDLTTEVRSIAREQIDQAIALLSDQGADRHEAIHLSRRRLKRARAMLRLVRAANEDFARTEIARYRDVARSLSGARDAAALVEAFDAFRRDRPRKLGGKTGAEVHRALAARRDRIAGEPSNLEEEAGKAIAECRAGRAALDALHLPARPEAAARLLARGAARTYKKARRALDEARADPAPERVHVLRKRVNDHLFQLRLLRGLDPKAFKSRRKQVSALAQHLGHHHDLCVMRARLAAEPELLPDTRTRDRLAALIAERIDELDAQILTEAEPLFSKKPDKWRAGIEGLYLAAARPSYSHRR